MRQWLNLSGALLISVSIAYLSLAPIFSGSPGSGFGISLFAIGHLFSYLMLAFSVALYLHDTSLKNRLAVALAFSFCFGAAMELIQGQLAYRFFGWDDMLYNGLGASLVLVDRSGRVREFVVELEESVLGVSTFNVRA